MKTTKTMLLATVAAVVLATGISPKSAQAFDSVNWTWEKTVTEDIVKNVSIDIENNPTGMLELEKTQTQIGDVTATSSISNVSNNPPETGEAQGGTIHVTIPVDLDANYDSNAANNPVTGVTMFTPGFTDGNASGHDDQAADVMHLMFDLTGDVAFEPGDVTFTPTTVQDGLDLPSIESAATAVGNNQTIESDVSLDLHDGQFLYGGYDTQYSGQLANLDTSGVSGNVNTNAAAFLTFAGALGGITPASITANSDVSDILNASVDSSATAVGNNMDVTLAAATADDALMIADATQYSFADISATSSVDSVTVNSYDNLAALTGPLVSSTATAVGNNFSVKITSPAGL